MPAVVKVTEKLTQFLTTDRIAAWARDFSIGLATVLYGFDTIKAFVEKNLPKEGGWLTRYLGLKDVDTAITKAGQAIGFIMTKITEINKATGDKVAGDWEVSYGKQSDAATKFKNRLAEINKTYLDTTDKDDSDANDKKLKGLAATYDGAGKLSEKAAKKEAAVAKKTSDAIVAEWEHSYAMRQDGRKEDIASEMAALALIMANTKIANMNCFRNMMILQI